jgi:hypothetical protein
LATASEKLTGSDPDRIASAPFGPMPPTVSSNSNSARSSRVKNP